MNEIAVEMTVVTPEMAINWLDCANNKNRRFRPWWSEALASAIKRGEWIATHQGIAFTKSGRLLDGQHRLKAVALANKAVEMLVFNGIPDEAFSVIDIGVKRSYSDTTGLTKKSAETARFLASLTYGGAASPQQVRAIAESGVDEVHERLMAYCSTTKAVSSATPVRAAAVLLVMDGHSEQFVFKTYADTVNKNFAALPPVALGFVRQIGTKALGHKSLDLLARSLKFLNPMNSELTKIQVTEADEAAASAYGRSILKRAFSAAPRCNHE